MPVPTPGDTETGSRSPSRSLALEEKALEGYPSPLPRQARPLRPYRPVH